MNGLLKYVFTWFAGVFNLGVYLTDNIDTLLLRIHLARQQQLSNHLEDINSIIYVLEITKLALITLSFICIVVMNHQEFIAVFKKKWNFIKKGFWFLKDKFSNFKNKKRL